MLRECGAEPDLHYDGLERLMRRQRIDASSARSLAGSTLRLSRNRRLFGRLVERLRGADLIIVVANVPISFSPTVFPNIELLRERLPETPIVNYDLHYLPTLDSWSRFILGDERTGLSEEAISMFAQGKFGMERYDWYLMASVGTYVPMPEGPQPYTLIGIDLDDGTLFPEQRGRPRILLDFAQDHGDFPRYRQVQLEALRLAGVDYDVLAGSYTIAAIREIYRKTSLYLLSRSEAFGLPIAELQACGSLVFLPSPHWACAHWLGDDYSANRVPRFTDNFVLYENDPAHLASRLRAAASSANPAAVRARFLDRQPELFRGDRMSLAGFLKRVERGEIHSRLHLKHRNIGRKVFGV